MTFDTTEKSIQDGRPRELYTFELSGGTYRLTPSKEDETYGGNVYTSTPGLSRGNVAETPLGQQRELTVSLPVNHAIAASLIRNGIPPRGATLTILRFHDPTDSAYQVWVGGIAEIQTEPNTQEPYARLRVPSLIEIAFDVKLPIAKASRICQHALYGPGCRAVRGGANVSVLDVDGYLVTLAIGDPDGFLNGGEIVRIIDNEARTIVEQVGNVCRVDVPFPALASGETVNIVPGCDGLIATCRDKFDNVVNFGGLPLLPLDNPSTFVRVIKGPANSWWDDVVWGIGL
jgi:hypothetical protein